MVSENFVRLLYPPVYDSEEVLSISINAENSHFHEFFLGEDPKSVRFHLSGLSYFDILIMRTI